MRILICNDDGIAYKGIHALINAFKGEHEVIVIAPDGERSGFSHSVTIFKSFNYSQGGVEGVESYAVSGTPADCVKLGVLHILKKRPPDLVISGINSGPNLGGDVMYSGTVAGASEGVYLGIPAIALSLGFWINKEDSYKKAADFLKQNLDTLYKIASDYAGQVMLNINYPVGEVKGVVFTKTGVNAYCDYYFENEGEEGKANIVQLKGEPVTHKNDINSCDVAYIKQGFVTITPLQLDRTRHDLVEEYKDLKFKI